MKFAVFGGTFDPIHLAHLQIAHLAIENGRCDQVLFIPAFEPPHKEKSGISPYALRKKMLELSLEDSRKFRISDIEAERGGKSYTLDTMHELHRRYPTESFSLLIGADSLMQLHTWYSAKVLVNEFEIITYPRGGVSVNSDTLAKYWDEAEISRLLQGVMDCVSVSEVSSSEIRQLAFNGNWEKLQQLIHPAVFSLIRTTGLYQKN